MTMAIVVLFSLAVGATCGALWAGTKEQKPDRWGYDTGWADGYEVGRSEVQKRVRKVKITPTKEK